MMIVVFCCCLIPTAKALLFPYYDFDLNKFLSQLILIFTVYLICYVIIKPYLGIVRYSGYIDTIKLLVSVVIATSILVANNYIVEYTTGYRVLSHNVLIAGMGLAIMFGSATIRVIAKALYAKGIEYESGINKKIRAVILGTETESVTLANKLKHEIKGKYEPVAFLWIKEERYTNAEIDGLPIKRFSPEKVGKTFANLNADVLIFEPSQIATLRNGGIDAFLDADIKVRQISDSLIRHSKGDANIPISCNVHDIQIEQLLNRDVIVPDVENINNFIKNKIVLVTGAAGSIGSEIVRQLAKYKAKKIVMLDNAETPMHNILLEMQNCGYGDIAVPVMGDVRNLSRIESVFNKYKPQVVFHAAAYKHVPMMELHPSEAIRTNVGGSKNLADISLKYNVEKFVMVSTDKAVNPTNVMGASKRLAEIYVQSLALYLKNREGNFTKFVTTRFGNVLGSNGSVVPLFKEQISKGGPVTITDKQIIRYFMTIPEACELVLEAGYMGNGGEIFVFDMGQPVKIYDLAKRMIKLSGLKPYTDIDIVETGLRPGEKLYEELLNDKEITDSTKHKRIMIGKVRKYDYDEVTPKIENLIDMAWKFNDEKIVAAMKEIIPEYISQNSKFETLDKKDGN
ncbi:MAG: polysaccharide biosynthesis protein [Bacteroidales bacterium]|nr:polysaccharide biosynthesis protein [Bacteroidales bacterium]